jgi:hypothetical protein
VAILRFVFTVTAHVFSHFWVGGGGHCLPPFYYLLSVLQVKLETRDA